MLTIRFETHDDGYRRIERAATYNRSGRLTLSGRLLPLFSCISLKTGGKPEQAGWLLQGVETALQQPDRGLLCHYLQKCAAVFLGFVPASVFADIVSRAQPLLLTGGEQEVFYALGF